MRIKQDKNKRFYHMDLSGTFPNDDQFLDLYVLLEGRNLTTTHGESINIEARVYKGETKQ